MENNEQSPPDSHPEYTFDITPESIEAFRHSDTDLEELLERIKRTNGKLALELYALAEDYRSRSKNHSTEDKAAFISGLLTTLKLQEMQKDSLPLAEIFELPAYTDENHTPTDPPLSA